MNIAIIHPVRNIEQSLLKEIEAYVKGLEAEGHIVHLPIRDTNQNGTSLSICQNNVQKIKEADRVDVFYIGDSQGSHFDLGAAYALSKEIYVVRSIPLTQGKSFQNFLKELCENQVNPNRR